MNDNPLVIRTGKPKPPAAKKAKETSLNEFLALCKEHGLRLDEKKLRELYRHYAERKFSISPNRCIELAKLLLKIEARIKKNPLIRFSIASIAVTKKVPSYFLKSIAITIESKLQLRNPRRRYIVKRAAARGISIGLPRKRLGGLKPSKRPRGPR